MSNDGVVYPRKAAFVRFIEHASRFMIQYKWGRRRVLVFINENKACVNDKKFSRNKFYRESILYNDSVHTN